MLRIPQQNLETVTEPFFESGDVDHEIEPLLTLTCAPHFTHKFFASSKSWSWLEDYFVHNFLVTINTVFEIIQNEEHIYSVRAFQMA